MTTKGPDEKFCGDCGEAIKIRAEICPKCGVRQVPEKSASTGGAKNKGSSLFGVGKVVFG